MKNKNQGFMLIGVLIVLLIIGLLIGYFKLYLGHEKSSVDLIQYKEQSEQRLNEAQNKMDQFRTEQMGTEDY